MPAASRVKGVVQQKNSKKKPKLWADHKQTSTNKKSNSYKQNNEKKKRKKYLSNRYNLNVTKDKLYKQ
jgi:hypothetical protein